MDQATLVDHRIEEAHKLVDRLDREGRLPVSAAFWVDSIEDQQWTLHLVSPVFDAQGMKHPYLAINVALREHPEIQLDAREILPQASDDLIVVEVLEFLRRYPAPEAFRLRGVFLKGRYVQWAYIYPIKLDEGSGQADGTSKAD